MRSNKRSINLKSLFQNTFIVCAVTLLCSCGSFAEATFPLAYDCRLPKWLELPAGIPRKSVAVVMDTYVTDEGGRTANFTSTSNFTMYDHEKKKIGSITAVVEGNEPIDLKNSKGSQNSYEIMTVNGVTDVIQYSYDKK